MQSLNTAAWHSDAYVQSWWKAGPRLAQRPYWTNVESYAASGMTRPLLNNLDQSRSSATSLLREQSTAIYNQDLLHPDFLNQIKFLSSAQLKSDRRFDSDAWDVMRAKVRNSETFCKGWDGDFGVAPTKQIVDAAVNLLDQLEQANSPLPRFTLSGDGEIDFRWEKGDGYASAAFLPEGEFVAYCRPPDEDEAVEIEEKISENVRLEVFLIRLLSFS